MINVGILTSHDKRHYSEIARKGRCSGCGLDS